MDTKIMNNYLSAEQIGDYLKFIKENMVVKILSHKDVFGVEPPTFVELE